MKFTLTLRSGCCYNNNQLTTPETDDLQVQITLDSGFLPTGYDTSQLEPSCLWGDDENGLVSVRGPLRCACPLDADRH
jgi:hypothetical protein